MSLPDNALVGHCAQSGRKVLPVCLDQALCFSAGIKIEAMRAKNVASIAREGEHKPLSAALGGSAIPDSLLNEFSNWRKV